VIKGGEVERRAERQTRVRYKEFGFRSLQSHWRFLNMERIFSYMVLNNYS
jgi:hypothetical protein